MNAYKIHPAAIDKFKIYMQNSLFLKKGAKQCPSWDSLRHYLHVARHGLDVASEYAPGLKKYIPWSSQTDVKPTNVSNNTGEIFNGVAKDALTAGIVIGTANIAVNVTKSIFNTAKSWRDPHYLATIRCRDCGGIENMTNSQIEDRRARVMGAILRQNNVEAHFAHFDRCFVARDFTQKAADKACKNQ